MSADRYVCCDEHRRAQLAKSTAPAGISGIDYIEVQVGPTTSDPATIDIVLVKALTLPAAQLTGDNIELTGGVRFRPPKVDPVVAALPGGGVVERYQLTIPGGQLTDFSTYRLALVAGPGAEEPPPFIDPRLSSVDFSFRIGCPSDFDCAPDCDGEEEPAPDDPAFDYRVRDYPGFRRQMLDRLAALIPGFREDDPLDLTTTLVELAAYRADQQSYRLDWVGTEAFLGTARSRTSIARHARLVDYAPGEGASARVFARFVYRPATSADDGAELAASTPLLVRLDGEAPVIPAEAYRTVLARGPLVFETGAAIQLWAWRNAIEIHTWGDDECRLTKGATAATLVDKSGGAGALSPGDFVLFAEIRSPETGFPPDARPDRRHVVRLTRVTPAVDVLDSQLKLATVEWDPTDALPFDLVIQTRVEDALGAADTKICAEAAANITLADHGASFPPATMLGLPSSDVDALRPKLEPKAPEAGEPWRPVLDRADVTRAERFDLAGAPRAPAAVLGSVDPGRCLPVLHLDDDFQEWEARRDLLESGPFGRHFVIETAIGGRPVLRFGDGIHGLAPSVDAALSPRGRFGVGPQGNIGVGALAHVVVPTALASADLTVTNPLPARGAAAAESISEIRIAAPFAFRRQERAVTAADYAWAAMRHPGVANAVAIPRWTGAWQTMLVFIDRRDGLAVDKAFRRELLEHIERYRLMGFDVALRGAVAAPLHIGLMVCARPDELRSAVAARVRDVLRPSGGSSGRRGFFHPENFTFGSPLYLSKLIGAVMAVKGVQSVTAKTFQRFGRIAQGELAEGVIRPVDVEVLQLSDDPSFPEQGRLELELGGGR